MSYPAGLSANLSLSSGEAAEEAVRSGAMCVEIVRLEDGSALDWCQSGSKPSMTVSADSPGLKRRLCQ